MTVEFWSQYEQNSDNYLISTNHMSNDFIRRKIVNIPEPANLLTYSCFNFRKKLAAMALQGVDSNEDIIKVTQPTPTKELE